MNIRVERTSRELLRLMECLRKTSTDTKGAVHVALESIWFDLQKIVERDLIELGSVLDKYEEIVAEKHEKEGAKE